MLRRSSNLAPLLGAFPLLEKLHHDALRNGRRHFASMTPSLHEYCEGDAGMLARREPDEPSIVSDGLGEFLALDPRGSLDHLRGAGLAANVQPWDGSLGPGTSLVHHLPHSLLYHLERGGLQVHSTHDLRRPNSVLHSSADLAASQKVRPVESASVPDERGKNRHLHGSHLQRSLSDGDRDGLARVPGLVAGAPFPLLVGNGAGFFMHEIHPGPLAEAQAMRPLGYQLDPEVFSKMIKIDVAGFLDRFHHRDGAVASLLMTEEFSAVDYRVPGAEIGATRRGLSRLQRCNGQNNLENRPRRELALDGTVLERVSLGIDERSPVLRRETAS